MLRSFVHIAVFLLYGEFSRAEAEKIFFGDKERAERRNGRCFEDKGDFAIFISDNCKAAAWTSINIFLLPWSDVIGNLVFV